MSEMIYNWERYWCLRDGGGFHIDANGFLVRSDYYKDTFDFASIAHIPCLIMLGEPGIGKSRAVKDAVQFVRETLQEEKCFPLDLRSFGSEGRLYDALFKSNDVLDWINGTHRLHLFLDSFDECLLRVDTIATLLADEFGSGKYPTDRLLFRVVSRTAEFPRSLENALRAIWTGKEQVQVYELCPLQASDVQEAALVNELSPEAFFDEIVAKNAGTLAARPVTLRFLLNLYRKNNRLPSKLINLYEEGCRVLCEESNEDRRSSKRVGGSLTADQKLIIAARIAAIMVFCNKVAVWKDAQTGESEETDILLRDLSGYSETLHNIGFRVTEARVRETLFHTGLFTARGPHRMGWAHQTFAEFLAAWYVSRHKLGKEELLSLITHPLDVEKQVTPQLQETAAWLASLRADIFDELIITNPILLLRSDVASFSPEMRAKLVEELLKIFAEEKASDWRLDYDRLKHSTLASQLLPIIKDKDAHYLARRFAIDVAERCELHELQNDLVEVILDESEPDYVRANAGYALWRVGDAETRKRIKHFALNGSLNDTDERVRGIALLCNWNENMSAEEAFNSLIPSPHLHDSYSLFLGRFTEKLPVEDLPVALRWVKENASNFEHDYSVARVIDEIMLLAWQNLKAPGVLLSFAKASLIRLRSLEHDLIDLSHINQPERFKGLLADEESRRAVLKAIVPLVDDEKHDSLHLSLSLILQPRKEDLLWLLDQLNEARTMEEQKTWLQFLGNFYFGGEIPPENLSVLENVYHHNDAVKKYYSWVFTPVELNSPEAELQREAYEKQLSVKKQRDEKLKKNALKPPPKEMVIASLNKFETGDLNSWWNLNLQLGLTPYSKYVDELEFDLRKMPGWKEATDHTKSRIVEAAKRYVIEGEPQNDEWLGTRNIFRPAFSGYRALYLLLYESPEFVKQVPIDVWQKWAAMIVCYPLNSFGGDEMNPHQLLVTHAYANAPDQVINAVLTQIDADNDRDESFYFPQRLEVCWDTKFKDALRDKLGDSTLKTNSWGAILGELLQHEDALTRKIAENVVISFVAGKSDKEQALLAAAGWMQYGEGNDWWPFVWKAIQKDTDFGRVLVESVCSQTHLTGRLNEDEASDFYLWLVKVFPPAEDPQLPMGHAFAVTTRMEVTKFRNSFLNDLKHRGTPESLTALAKIAATSPELEKQLHWILIEARQNVRRHTWKPPTPSILLSLIKQTTGEPTTIKKSDITYIQSDLKPLDYVNRLRKNESKSVNGTQLKVFLCHSSNDKAKVRNLYQRLNADQIQPWLDEVDLLAGQDWEYEIKKAVKTSHVVVVCLSKDSINKSGYVQREIKQALDVADEKPEGTVFIIPLKLEECELPDRLSRWHWVNYFEESGYERLIRALRSRAASLGLSRVE